MTFFQAIIRDLVERHLLPVVAVCLAIAVGVPAAILLTSSSSSTPPTPAVAPPVAPTGATQSPAQALAAASATPTQPSVYYSGSERDPFGAAGGSGAGKSAAPASGATGSTKSTTAKSPTTTTTPTATTKTTTTTTTPPPPPAPVPTNGGLTSSETFDATLEVTNGGNSAQLSDVERLTPLPSTTLPQVVYYGVMPGGKEADFIILGGESESGGSCVPGPEDCELVEVPTGTSLTVTPQSGSSTTPANTTSVTVTSITVAQHSSPSAASFARSLAVAQGAQELKSSGLTVLQVFPYNATYGYVADDNSLSVAGEAPASSGGNP